MRLRLRSVLLLSNLAILALPVAGLWALRLYESALLRQTEAGLVAQGAVLASVFREQLHLRSGASAAGTPPLPAAAALHMAGRQGLDFARDKVLPPQPDVGAGPPGEAGAVAAGAVLAPVLRDVQSVTLASLRITDRRGVIVATTGSDLGRSLSGWDEVSRALAGEPVASGIHLREPAQVAPGGLSRTAGVRVFVAMPVADAGGEVAGAVVLSRTPSSVIDTVWGKRAELAGLAVLLLAGGAGLALGISRLVTRPLAVVVRQAQAVAAGGRMGVAPARGVREVVALSAAIGRMAATLEQRADYIRGFAASVSHEFKTPMAAIRAAGELLEDHAEGMAPAERRHLLGLVADGVARLEALVRRLVELARADVMRAGMEGEGAEVAPVVAAVAERFRGRGMRVVVEGVAGRVGLPAAALEALLDSLLENAAVHAPGAEVRISAAVAGREVVIAVRDDGPGIAAVHREKVFEAFFTTARKEGGTGLGLPIVRAIAGSVGGSVELEGPGVGAGFLVRMPKGHCRLRTERG